MECSPEHGPSQAPKEPSDSEVPSEVPSAPCSDWPSDMECAETLPSRMGRAPGQLECNIASGSSDLRAFQDVMSYRI